MKAIEDPSQIDPDRFTGSLTRRACCRKKFWTGWSQKVRWSWCPKETLKQEEDASEAETAEPETPAAEATVEVEAETTAVGDLRIRRRVTTDLDRPGAGEWWAYFAPPAYPYSGVNMPSGFWMGATLKSTCNRELSLR